MLNLEPGVRAALDEVQAKGKVDGNEHVAVVRNGQIVYRKDGTENMVDLRGSPIQAGDILIHNHPKSLNSLSNADVVQVYAHGLQAVYAISDDDSVYKASKGEAVRGPGTLMMAWEMASDFLLSRPGIPQVAQELPMVHGRLNEAHWICRMLDHQGAISYSYELGDETSKLVSKVDQMIAFHPEDMTPADALARLFSTLFPGINVVGMRG